MVSDGKRFVGIGGFFFALTLGLFATKTWAFVPSGLRRQQQPHRRRPSFLVREHHAVVSCPSLFRSTMCMASASASPDGEALQALFASYCDSDGLMTKTMLKKVPEIAALLLDGDLLPKELDEIWSKAPKFPTSEDRIDVDSFIQVYRDVDDLFEEDDNEEDASKVEEESAQDTPPPEPEEEEEEESEQDPAEEEEEASTVPEDASDDTIDAATEETIEDIVEEAELEEETAPETETAEEEKEIGASVEEDEEELETAFETICDNSGLVSRDSLLNWDEIKRLIQDGLLGESEFQEIWEKTPKIPGSTDQLDVEGFLSFNVALDDLFVFEEEKKKPVVTGQSVGALFDALASGGSFIGREDLERWGELQNMLEDDDLTRDELDEFYNKSSNDDGKLDRDGFVALYQDIDSLFEDDDDEPSEVSDTVSGTLFDELFGRDAVIDREDLMRWDELEEMIEEGDLTQSELNSFYKKYSNKDKKLDRAGFEALSKAIESLFEYEDDDDDEEMDDDKEDEDEADDKEDEADDKEDEADDKEDEEEDEVDNNDDEADDKEEAPSAGPMVSGETLTPNALFDALATNALVGRGDLECWQELQDMLQEGDLLRSELDEFYQTYAGDDSKLNRNGFIALFKAIDALFEEEEEEPVKERTSEEIKSIFLDFLGQVSRYELPCGLDGTAEDDMRVTQIVELLEQSESNRAQLSFEESEDYVMIQPEELAGTWTLLYSTSEGLRFHSGFSGLGGTFPRGKFGGLNQTLTGSQLLPEVEYTERILVDPDVLSFDVKVTGYWDLDSGISLRSTEIAAQSIKFEAETLSYGLTSQQADYWDSMQHMNVLDISYLDDDLRIMRGKKAIFVFQRTSS